MGYNLFSEHGDTVGVGFARPKNTELLIKNVRETTDSGEGMALCLCVPTRGMQPGFRTGPDKDAVLCISSYFIKQKKGMCRLTRAHPHSVYLLPVYQ